MATLYESGLFIYLISSLVIKWLIPAAVKDATDQDTSSVFHADNNHWTWCLGASSFKYKHP